MSDKNNNAGPSPFHKKGTEEGDDKKNWMGRRWSELYTGGTSAGGKIGKDEFGIEAARGKVDKTFGEFGAIDTSTNLWEGAENKMSLTNTMEDLTVNQKQFELQKQMSQQGAANAMDTFRSAAGGSGVAGMAQAIANQQAQSAQQISASIGQQESANQMASAQQESRNQVAMGQGEMEAQKFKLQGAADARDLSLQQKQGQLSFLAGQQEAAQANKDYESAGKSDRRLKKNITKIGESNRGFNIYSFEYKDSLDGKGLFQGVMSDEIPQEAVTNIDGYDMVNYSMLDVEFKQI